MREKWTGDIIGALHVSGLTAKDLAIHMGLHPKYVSSVLNGRRSPGGPGEAEERFRKALDELTNNLTA